MSTETLESAIAKQDDEIARVQSKVDAGGTDITPLAVWEKKLARNLRRREVLEGMRQKFANGRIPLGLDLSEEEKTLVDVYDIIPAGQRSW